MPPEKIDQKTISEKIAEQTEKVKKWNAIFRLTLSLFQNLWKKSQQENFQISWTNNFQNKRFLHKKNIALSAFPKTKTFML